MAALICTEVLANNKDKSEDTYVATVDVQKAFDSVFHPSLLRKLFIATEADATWPLFSYLLHNIEVKVRIGPLKSKCVTLNQGVGQGRIPSTSQYKLHLDRLLSTLESSGLGSHIGPFSQPRWLSGLRRSRVHSLVIARRSLCPEKLGSNPGQGSKGINFSGWHGLDMSITVTKRR